MFRILQLLFRRPRLRSFDNLKVVLIFLSLTWYSAAGYLYFELPRKPDLSWADALWWTIVTMTTVGYGDYFPGTNGGRFLVGVPTMIFGIGFLGFIISETAARLIDARSKKMQGLSETRMTNHIIIINYTVLEEIQNLVDELRADYQTSDKKICLVDEHLSELPPSLARLGIEYVRGNPADESTLERASLPRASHAIVLSKDRGNAHSDDQNLVTTLIMEKLNPNVFSVVEAVDPRKVHQIEVAGADSVVCVSSLRSNLIIQEIQDPGVKSVVQELTSNSTGEQFYFVPVESLSEWTYASLVNWGLGAGYSVLGLVREGKTLLRHDPTAPVLKGDKAILIGSRRISAVKA